jgi:hypothetical protein
MTHLEASRAPIHELYGAFRLDGCYCSIHVLGNNIAPVDTGITGVRCDNSALTLWSTV